MKQSVKQVCPECNLLVLVHRGKLITHPYRGLTCDGSGIEADGESLAVKRANTAGPEKSEPKPTPSQPLSRSPIIEEVPWVEPERVPKPVPLKLTARPDPVQGEMAAPRVRVRQLPNENSSQSEGSIDFEKLRDCGCPSLRAAIERFLEKMS